MAQGNPEKERLYGRLNSIDSELSQAAKAVENAETGTNSVSASVGTLAARLAGVRGQGYVALGHLDKTVDLLSKKWAEIGPSVQRSVAQELQPIAAQVRGLQSETSSLRREIDGGNLGAAEGLANRLSGDAASIRSRAVSESERVTAPLRELSTGVVAVERDLKVAESSMALFGQAHFPMQQGESPVLAVEGKLMEGEKAHGTIYLTNHRFIFEGLKEVDLEKHLFIVTKKRIDRVVMIEQPVGAVQEITKGRVGLLAGTGVFVQFRPEVRLPVTPIDVQRLEADVIARFHRYVIGGEADRDIATARGGAPPTPTIQMLRCSVCGAPHSGEIMQGQASVSCEYCGTSMAIR